MLLILRFPFPLKKYKILAMQGHDENFVFFFWISLIVLKEKTVQKYEGHTLRSTSSCNPDPTDLGHQEKNKS
jgi:hypothetical protein